jgi:tartrate dehydratase alpha subunit/fumarate hydratase class I-like protein
MIPQANPHRIASVKIEVFVHCAHKRRLQRACKTDKAMDPSALRLCWQIKMAMLTRLDLES